MLHDLLYRLRAVFRKKQVEDELDDELRFHLEQQAAKLVRAGYHPEEAKRLARLSLHGPEQTRERCREARGTAVWESLVQDLRYAFRQMKGAPGFSLVAILIMALGIGANTAMFSLLDAVVLRSLPVKDPQQLLVPGWTAKTLPHPYGQDDYGSCFEPSAKGGCTFPYPVFESIEAKRDLFSRVTAFAGPEQFNVSGHGPASVLSGQLVSATFFQTLGVQPALGRTFASQDDNPSANATVVLSYAYWQSAFAGDPSVLGKTIRLNASPFTVIGVASPGFNRLSPGSTCELWIPLHQASNLNIDWLSPPLSDRHHFWLRIVARLEPGVTAAHAASELTALFKNDMLAQSKVFKPGSAPAIDLVPADKALTGIRDMLAKPLIVLMCAVALILLTACTNLAGLITARSAARQREIAIRLAVGAGRSRIVRQLLTESLVIALLGGLAGLALAFCGIRLLRNFIPEHVDATLDLRVLLFTAVTSLAAGLLFGILPALRSTRTLHKSMAATKRQSWLSNSLVVAQVAAAVVLLVGAALMLRTLVNLQHVNPGFNSNNLLLFGLDPVSLSYKDEQVQTLYRTLRDRLSALPGVTAVSYSQNALLSGSRHSSAYKIEGRHDRTPVPIDRWAVGPAFFPTMGIPLLAGRTFTPAEFVYSRPVALVNHAFVQRYFPARSPLGFHFGEDSPKAVQYEIVGVVGDVKHTRVRDLIEPAAYMPLRSSSVSFEVRTAREPSSLMPTVRRMVAQLDPDLPVFDMKTQTEQIDELLVVERLIARLSSGFGVLALTLACIGLYGLLSFDVARRTREIGIRMAMGAAPAVIRQAILRETLAIVALGLALGIPAALASTRLLAAMLYGIQPRDPATLVLISVLLVFVSGVAGYLPARRASLVDPAIALRQE